MKFDENIEKIEKIIGYSFRDRSLLRQAFTRTSYCNEQNRERMVKLQSNEVLEFIGDGVLSSAVISIIMKKESERYEFGLKTHFAEGDFSNIKSKLSDKKNLSLSTEKLGLQNYLIMGEGDSRLGIKNQPSVMEDLFESIIGAIYIDCGMRTEPVISSVERMLDLSVYTDRPDRDSIGQSAKNALQEWCSHKSRRLPQPVYKTVLESGPDHKKEYVRACYIGDKIYGTGTGKNQKTADALAAEAALAELQTLNFKKKKSGDFCRKLSAFLAKHRAPAAEYTDLGESDVSTASEREYLVECRAMGKSARASGKSKKDARALAAERLLCNLSKNN